MDTDKVTAVLVKPAAGRIDQAALILCTDKGSETDGVKLSPALVEKTPDGDGGKERQGIDHFHAFLFPLHAGFFIFP